MFFSYWDNIIFNISPEFREVYSHSHWYTKKDTNKGSPVVFSKYPLLWRQDLGHEL